MSRRISLIFRFLVVLGLAIIMLFALARHYFQTEMSRSLVFTEESLILEVKPGDSFTSVLNRLKALDIIEHDWAAKWYIKQEKIGAKLRTGEFKFEKGITLSQLLKKLTSNETVQYKVQFIEGKTYKDALIALSNHPKIKQTITDLTDAQLLEKLGVGDGVVHLEGMFYPDTYNFHKGETDLAILKRSHQRLNQVLSEEWDARDKASPLKTRYEALILASIVEKETGAARERAEIAGVFSRRLQKKMRLQTDPTVIYGLGDRYKGNIKRKHLREDTPYNTYRIKGLPPTPIAMVGRAAIYAALHPDDGKSLYFVAKGDGTHQFSETIQQHNAAVRKYQLRRRADYRSTQ